MIPTFSLPAAGRIGLYVLLLLAAVVALRLAESVIVPLMFALLLASVLGPAALWLQEKLKIRWSLACVTVIVVMVLANLVLFFAFTSSVTKFLSQMTNEKQLDTYTKLRSNLEKISPIPLDEGMFPKNPKNINEIKVLQYVTDAGPSIFREVTLYSANWAWQVILVLFVTFFVLLEGKMLVRRVVAIFGPSPEVQSRATEVLMEMAMQIRTYLVWRTIINLGLGLVVGIVFQMFGLGQAWTWAILLIILNYIPYLGPVLASIPPFLDAFVSTEHPAVPIVIMLIYWALIVVEGWLIVPLLMGRTMDLNATTVMLACLFWPLVWGPTGLFLAMPIMAGIKAVLHSLPDLSVWADLMSSTDEEPRPPHGLLPAESANGQETGVLSGPPPAQRQDLPTP